MVRPARLGRTFLSRLCASTATMLILTACGDGGGGGGSGGSTPPPVATTPTPSPPPAPAPSPTPSAASIALQMSPGWNLGNSLEAIGGGTKPVATSQETAWGNPIVTQALMTAVAAQGFKSVRIPVAWNQYADGSDTIGNAWMNRVAEVVDYARKAGLYVVINVHWDGGWLQPTFADQAMANARLTTFWKQIATKFKDYDEHLLFAGTNEILVTNVYSAPTAENCTVQKGFNQKFVDAVRATGGKNATRVLIVQGYNTNIEHTIGCNAAMPIDTATNEMMMEVHYYDPYNFALNENSKVWQWGAGATDPTVTETWANESYVDAQFQKVKTTFVDKGVPVILGEYGAIAKTDLDPSGSYRTAWNRYITRSAYMHGMVPFYWDNGATGNHGFGLFDRTTATVTYPTLVTAIVGAAK